MQAHLEYEDLRTKIDELREKQRQAARDSNTLAGNLCRGVGESIPKTWHGNSKWWLFPNSLNVKEVGEDGDGDSAICKWKDVLPFAK